ncbi:MAG: FtsX-like permease family protein [Candidatus Heimdallarchaeaceae archaeon]
MKKPNGIEKNKPTYYLQNVFILTRTYVKNLILEKNKSLKELKTQDKILYFFSLLFFPIAVLFLPLFDFFLLFFLPGLHIFKPMFKAGWKYGLISSIGVTLAVSIITQYVFFIYSYQFQAFGLYLADEPRTYIQIEVEDLTISTYRGQYQDFDHVASQAINYINMSSRILQRDIFFELPTFTQTFDPLSNQTILPTMPLYGTEGKLRSFLSNRISEGVEPNNDFETVAIMTRDFYNHSQIRAGTNISLYVPISLDKKDSLHVDSAHTGNGTTAKIVNITGIIFLDEIPEYDISNSLSGIPLENVLQLDSGAAIVSWWRESALIVHNITVTEGRATIREDLFYDVEAINAFDIQTEIDTLKLIGVQLKEWYLTLSSYTSVRINSYLVDLMEKFRDEYGLYETFMFSFLSPIIVLTIILTVYAANLVRKKRDRQLTILTERGTNKRELGAYLALESLITGFISLVFGVLVGLPLAAILTKSSGFLSFHNTLVPLKLDPASVIIALLGSMGAIILIQLFNTITLLRKRDIEDYGKVEKSLPRFYKYFVDIIMIGFAIIIWFIFKLPALSSYQDITAKYVGIPAIVFMLFGSILFVQRLLPLFAKVMVKVTSSLGFDITSLSLRSIYRFQRSFVRSSVILTLSFSIVVSSIVVPYSYQDFNTNGAYYDLGADIVIRGFPIENKALIQNLENRSDILSTSVVRFVNLRDISGDIGVTYSVLAVNPETFIKTAYFRKDFSNLNLTQLLNSLKNPLDVLAQTDELAVLGNTVGSVKPITYQAYNESFRTIPPIGSPYQNLNLSLSIVGSFKYWPNLVTEISVTSVRALIYHLVVTKEFMNHVQVRPTDVINYLYVKVNSSFYSIEEVAKDISTFTSGMVSNAESEVFVKPDSPRSSILYSAINSTLLMSFAINTIIIALFASIQLIDKSKEIATMKAIGISTKQLLKYHLSMYISLLLYSTIFGLIIGYITSSLLMGVLTITRNIPPYSLAFPIAQITLVLAILLVTAIIGAIIPTLTSTKQEIGTELRQSA